LFIAHRRESEIQLEIYQGKKSDQEIPERNLSLLRHEKISSSWKQMLFFLIDLLKGRAKNPSKYNKYFIPFRP
jgi:hypothetical protein